MSWVETNLGECCELYQPQTITTKDLIEDGKYLVYGANGVIGRYDKYNHEEPQLLVTCRGATCGSVNISLPYSWINGNAMVVKPKHKSIDVRFVEYFFRGAVDLGRAITGAAQPQITRQSLSPIKFQYPSISTQQKIVAKLDAIFAEIEIARASAEDNAKNAETLFQSYLTQVFERGGEDWKIKKLSEVSSFDKQQGMHTGIPYIGMENIQSHTTELISGIDLVEEVKSSTFKFNDTHLLYGRLRPDLNKVYTPDFIGHCSTEIFPIKPLSNLLRDYLKYWFINAKTVDKINATCTGARMPRANMNAVMEFDFPLPPLSTQKQLVNKFNSIQNSTHIAIDCYKAKIVELKAFKQSILQQAFSGELVKDSV